MPSSNCTSTLVPASTLPVSSPRMMKQLASLMDLRIPEPCSPVGFTVRVPSGACERMPRWNSVRPGAFFSIAVQAANPNHVFLYEVYDNEAALNAHRQTEHFKKYQTATANMIADRNVRAMSVIAFNSKGH